MTFIKSAICTLWLFAVGTGFVVILNYQTTGGGVGVTPEQWPAGATVALDGRRDTLIMFAHPQCACSRASVEELNRLLAHSAGNVASRVLFLKPPGFPSDWTRSGLWKSVAAIPGVTVEEDPDGAQARLFGAQTSGYLVLYSPRGRLLFKGGITAGRGHAGDNEGEDTVVALITRQDSILKQTRVYGCSLLSKCEVPSERPAN